MITKIQKWGNSQGLRFTKAVLEEARLELGDEVNVSVKKGRIVVEPVPKAPGKYDLKKLVSQIPKDYRPEELDWGVPMGRETW